MDQEEQAANESTADNLSGGGSMTNLTPDVTGPDAEHSISAREPERRSLADDVERFLQKGGEIKAVPKDFRADPPKKPENNYGRGSI